VCVDRRGAFAEGKESAQIGLRGSGDSPAEHAINPQLDSTHSFIGVLALTVTDSERAYDGRSIPSILNLIDEFLLCHDERVVDDDCEGREEGDYS
jgi:hypothetical protein